MSRVRGRLLALGVVPGDRVIIGTSTTVAARVLELAVLSGGYVRVAVSTRVHPRELGSLAADCGGRLAVVDDAAVGEVRGAVASDCLVVGIAQLEGGEPTEPTEPTAIAMLIYTSGSTGPAKGAIVTHDAWQRQTSRALAQLPEISGDDLVLAVAQLPHFGGSIALNCAIASARTIFLPHFDAAEVVREVERHGVTILPLATTMLERVVDELGDRRLPTLRAVVYGGSAISPASLARAARALPSVLIQFYGLAEALAPLTCLTSADHDAGRALGSAGRWLPGVEHRFVDGVLEVGGDVVMPGYINRGRAAIDAAGWLRTGDLAHDDDGYLYLGDRADDVITSGGYSVQPREVENVLAALDEIVEVAVVGTPHDIWGQGVTAVVVARDPGIDPAGLLQRIQAHSRHHLASYKKPVALHLVDHIPRNPAGKPDRAQILELIRTPRQNR